jgi:hypothetical protein
MSRSVASARQRRTGESINSRPGTSIASQSAFAQQQQPNNVRIAKAPIQQVDQSVQQNPNGLPFTKLTVSDAIGLITLRLGRVEQYIMDTQNSDEGQNHSSTSNGNNTSMFDNSVLTNIISRLDSIEKKSSYDQVSKIEKELKETKDLLMSFILKFELLSKETGERFEDTESAITDIETYIKPISEYYNSQQNVEKEKEKEKEHNFETKESNNNNLTTEHEIEVEEGTQIIEDYNEELDENN